MSGEGPIAYPKAAITGLIGQLETHHKTLIQQEEAIDGALSKIAQAWTSDGNNSFVAVQNRWNEEFANTYEILRRLKEATRDAYDNAVGTDGGVSAAFGGMA